jgi:hypothetical protein
MPSYGLSVNVYSGTKAGFFHEDIQIRVRGFLGLLMAVTERYVAFTLEELVRRGRNIQTRLTSNCPDLTPRERDVVAKAFKGRPTAENARDSGLGYDNEHYVSKEGRRTKG